MDEEVGMSREVRVLYQSFVDPNEQRPYFERLRKHLGSVADPDYAYEAVGISPPS